MGLVIADDSNQPRNESRYRKFWLEYSQSYQGNARKGGWLWRPYCEVREVKTMIKVAHDFKHPASAIIISIVGSPQPGFQPEKAGEIAGNQADMREAAAPAG
jgi:hypothetical protein